IPNMFDAAIEGTFMGIYVQGEDILQSDPNTKHVVAALSSMECVIVHDLFLNETANYAHVFLPGSTFLRHATGSPTGRSPSTSPRRWATICTMITRRKSWTRSRR